MISRKQRTRCGRVTLATLVLAGLGVGEPGTCAAQERDQEILGRFYSSPLSRLSLFADVGSASVRRRESMPPSGGRVAFDVGVLWDLGAPFRLGLAFNHFRFRQELGGADEPLEVSDLTAFARIDGREGRLIPYAQLGGGFYFAEDGARSDVVRGGVGLEFPASRVMLRLEGRLTSYGNGAYVDPDRQGRHMALGAVLGVRFPFAPGGTVRLERDDLIERARETLRYLATPEEQREIDALAGEAELLGYIDRFWARRDPFPEVPGNASREEHLERVELATRGFGEIGKAGWATERGRILIVHGRPDEVMSEWKVPRQGLRSPQPTAAGAPRSHEGLELWIYYRPLARTIGGRSFFLFEKDAVSRYRTIWTNVAGEAGYGRSLPLLPASIAAAIR